MAVRATAALVNFHKIASRMAGMLLIKPTKDACLLVAVLQKMERNCVRTVGKHNC
jgi:hypothetical protein